ncbi:unnamed protein product [Porites evermanni]|uniref:Uncharacterized protein n=1 Tax=Porites evermanni TaxID=104178 RepID=A0ABN8LRG0_9CNID|nr:unnamed protein product [Porites evermanni]
MEPAEATLQPANPAKRIHPLDLLKRIHKIHKRGINCPDGIVVSNTRRDKQMPSKVLFFGRATQMSVRFSRLTTSNRKTNRQIVRSSFNVSIIFLFYFFFQILYCNPWLDEPDISCYVISLQFKLSNPANRNIGA